MSGGYRKGGLSERGEKGQHRGLRKSGKDGDDVDGTHDPYGSPTLSRSGVCELLNRA